MTMIKREFELSDRGVLNLAYICLDGVKGGYLSEENLITVVECIRELDEEWGIVYP